MPSITVDGIGIGYADTRGPGPAVVLIHGWPFNSSLWDPQAEALSDRARIVAPDLMGFGASDAPDDPPRYSMATFADQVRSVIDDAGLDRVVLGGLSMGGYVCFDMWRRHRDVIGALILADTRAEADTPETIDKRTAQQEQARAEGITPVAQALLEGLLSESTRSDKPDVVARVRAVMDNPPHGYVGGLEAMKRRPDSTGDLVTIDVPTLVIVGEHDGITPPAVARTMHEHIGGSQLVVVPEAGHVSNLEGPEDFNGAIAGFLAGL
jgi:3-oxoadipate enol-lactonase